MRIAQLVETLDAGGAERLAISVAGALAARGHDSHLLTLHSGGVFKDRVSRDVRLMQLGFAPGTASLGLGALFPLVGALDRCRGYLLGHRIEVLQTHLPLANFLGLALRLQVGLAHFPTVHNNQEFAYGNQDSAVRMSLRRWAYRRMAVQSSGFVAVSPAVKDHLCLELGLAGVRAEAVAVVRNGVVLPEPVEPEERERLREGFGIPRDAILVAAVGRLAPQKNFPTLLTAQARLRAAQVDARCIIAGEGELRDDLEAQADRLGLAGVASLAGNLGRVDDLLRAADIFCMPSLWEGLPMALLEAMSHGLPIAAADIDGVREVLGSDRAGLMHVPGDAEGLARDLGRLARDGDLRRRLGAEARVIVARDFDFGRTVDDLERLFVAASNPGRRSPNVPIGP
ncbi:MAG: glycosyltransferase [Candidatus Krumholzibacteriia bacterium]